MKIDQDKNFYSGTQSKPPTTKKRRKKRRSLLSILLTIALAFTAFLLATATTGYFLITHRPTDYQPRQWSADPKIRKQEQKDAENRGLKKSEEFYNNSQRLEPFTFRLEQQIVNDLLLLDDTQTYLQRKWPQMSQYISQLQVSFSENQINVMGQITYNDVKTIMTISFQPTLLETEELQVNLTSVKAGALPIPESVINQQLNRLAEALKSTKRSYANPGNTHEQEGVEDLMSLLSQLLSDLIEKRNMTVPAVISVEPDNKMDKITGITIGDGYIDMDLQPFVVED
jgi:hypothetical protein